MNEQQQFLSVTDAYDRWSPVYDTYVNPMVFMATEIVSRSLADVQDSAVFEFGCGTGRNLAALASANAGELAGCDLSEGMLSIARSRVPSARLARHDMSVRTDEPDRSFDLAFFCLSLEHVADLRPPLREARRILKDGGRFRIIEIHPFLSLNGVGAHFNVDGIEFRMPTYSHRFQDYLAVFGEVELHVASCKEWTPNDVGNPEALQRVKFGPNAPLAVEFVLTR